MKKKKKFSTRLSRALYNASQPERSSTNTNGIAVSYGVTNGQDVDAVAPPERALKGKGVRYE